MSLRTVFSFLIRLGVTAAAFWWIFRGVDFVSLKQTILGANHAWFGFALALFFLAQFACIWRWHLLVPAHPSLTLPFLTNSFLVGNFFSSFLPTTVGGDVVRSYDLIKATGQWKEPLASVLLDRLIGLAAMVVMASAAWAVFPPARTDPVLRFGFLLVCGVLFAALAVLGSRRVLRATLKPFKKIGLGQLETHAKQFQESLLSYRHRLKVVLSALGISIVIQVLSIGIFAAIAQGIYSPIPLLFLVLIVPILFTVSQLPISLNGWGVREGATILFLARIGVEAHQALTISLIGGTLPLLSGAIGGILFLMRKVRKRR